MLLAAAVSHDAERDSRVHSMPSTSCVDDGDGDGDSAAAWSHARHRGGASAPRDWWTETDWERRVRRFRTHAPQLLTGACVLICFVVVVHVVLFGFHASHGTCPPCDCMAATNASEM